MKKIVKVIQEVEVNIDETKFTDEFMSKLKEWYRLVSIDDFVKYVAILKSKGGCSIAFDRLCEQYNVGYHVETSKVEISE
jgi:hypothetical protein